MNDISMVMTALIATAVTGLSGVFFIPFLKKIKFGQMINDIGPTWHKSKQGTPTMGGFMFIIGIFAAALIGFGILSQSNTREAEGYALMNNAKFFAGLFAALAFAFTGFVDDYIKVVKKRNLGLTEIQKLIMQITIGIIYLFTLYLTGTASTSVWIPFIGHWQLGLFYYPVALFIIVGFVNAVNLTDGLDGLASSITFVSAIAFMIAASLLKLGGMNILATALAGGCLGFLIWNFYPAKVMMGDTGSMFLGGLVIALAFGMDIPLILVLFGVIYWIDTFSVILQRLSVKLTGKRLFKMSPIHHHFEMLGYTEVKIVFLFSLIQFIGCVLGIIAIVLLV